MIRGKQFCYEEGLHVPLIIRWPVAIPAPAHYGPGRVDDRLIAAIDFAPTMLALAGQPVPPLMQGRVFLGDKTAPPREYLFGARDRCDETVFRFRTVRDARYRYIRNFTPDRPFLQANEYKARSYPLWTLLPQLHAEGKLTPAQAALCAPTMPEEELYDLSTDPHEIHNLAKDPAFREARDRLRRVLDEWIDATHDQGRTLEPDDLARKKGVTKSGTPPNSGYTLDGRSTGADVPGPARAASQ
jgi:arylsulfatase A-like enzyme